MKTIAIFNEKGGVGKTTLSALFADYLYFKKGENVSVIDMDAPSFHLHMLREKDLNILEGKIMPNQSLLNAVKNNTREPYPISTWTLTPSNAKQLVTTLTSIREKEDSNGYCLLDFAGGYRATDPAHMVIFYGLLDLLAIPLDVDDESIQSAYYLAATLKQQRTSLPNKRFPKIVAFWNRVRPNDTTRQLSPMTSTNKALEAYGVQVLKNYIPSSTHMMNLPRYAGFVRTTVCYPQRATQLGLPDFFEEILSCLPNTNPDTKK